MESAKHRYNEHRSSKSRGKDEIYKHREDILSARQQISDKKEHRNLQSYVRHSLSINKQKVQVMKDKKYELELH